MKYILKNDMTLRITMLMVIFLMALGGCTDFLEEVPTNQLTTSADLTSIATVAELDQWCGRLGT